jgi:hypothetical protein
LLLVDSSIHRYTDAMWWDEDEQARELRARIAKLQRECAELDRQHYGKLAPLYQNGIVVSLRTVVNGIPNQPVTGT